MITLSESRNGKPTFTQPLPVQTLGQTNLWIGSLSLCNHEVEQFLDASLLIKIAALHEEAERPL